jgi:hypothetical protein
MGLFKISYYFIIKINYHYQRINNKKSLAMLYQSMKLTLNRSQIYLVFYYLTYLKIICSINLGFVDHTTPSIYLYNLIFLMKATCYQMYSDFNIPKIHFLNK